MTEKTDAMVDKANDVANDVKDKAYGSGEKAAEDIKDKANGSGK